MSLYTFDTTSVAEAAVERAGSTLHELTATCTAEAEVIPAGPTPTRETP